MSSAPPAHGLAAPVRSLVQAFQERKGKTAADRELARRLHAAFAASPLDALGLSVYVHDGAIAIYGSVRDEAAREAVLALAAAQPGARRVADHLQLPSA